MEHVVQFDTKRRTLPGFDIPLRGPRNRARLRGGGTAAAWLSSALVVRCSLKWGIERNPHSMLYIIGDCPASNVGRKVGMMSSQHGAYVQGNTHPTMSVNKGLPNRKVELIPSKALSVRIVG